MKDSGSARDLAPGQRKDAGSSAKDLSPGHMKDNSASKSGDKSYEHRSRTRWIAVAKMLIGMQKTIQIVPKTPTAMRRMKRIATARMPTIMQRTKALGTAME